MESPLAKSVTSWPCRISSSVRYETTRSVPPYKTGGTLSISGEICAILILPKPPVKETTGDGKALQGHVAMNVSRELNAVLRRSISMNRDRDCWQYFRGISRKLGEGGMRVVWTLSNSLAENALHISIARTNNRWLIRESRLEYLANARARRRRSRTTEARKPSNCLRWKVCLKPANVACSSLFRKAPNQNFQTHMARCSSSAFPYPPDPE
jgi:hypothetical protein